MNKTITFFLILFFSTSLSSTRAFDKFSTYGVPKNINDIYILAFMAQDYLSNSNVEEFDVKILSQIDSSLRISTNFEKLNLVRKRDIILQFKFSVLRDWNTFLTPEEQQKIPNGKIVLRTERGDYNGEIRLKNKKGN